MPTVIREALSARIRRLPELQQFLRDFKEATGVPVEFVGPLGHGTQTREVGPLCRYVQQSGAGCRFCSKAVQSLLEQSSTEPVSGPCDLRLSEFALPLRAGGQTFGYLLVGGYFTAAPTLAEKNRLRHLLERLGVPADLATVDELCARTPLMDAERQGAISRILTLAARHLVLAITDNLSSPTEKLPPLVKEACNQARRTFTQHASLSQIAKTLGVTTGHLCRVFHQSTGLRFREYVGRLRADYARDLLLSSERTITDIAFASGFQSISQFNRVFRSVHGVSPQQLRRQSTTPPRPGDAAVRTMLPKAAVSTA